MTHRQESGFSAIELLITLFVLAAFLIAGVQLYNVVINDGGASRAESRAANLAYNYLRQNSTATTSPCAEATPVDGESVSVQGLIDVSVTVTVTCPHGVTSEISKVEASISYNNPSETVTYATYVIGQNGDESSVTDSLVGWWRFNGNANDYVTGASGTVSGASLTTGQNGQANGAYSFDGTNDYVEISPSITNFSGFSVSVWARGVSGPAANSGYGYIVHRGIGSLVGNSVYWIASDVSLYRGDVSGNVSSDTTTAPGASTWRLLTLTYDGTTRNVYVDGDLQASDARAFTNTTTGTRLGIGGTPHDATYRPFQGEIDDVRLYNKTLSESEVQTLFSEGAF